MADNRHQKRGSMSVPGSIGDMPRALTQVRFTPQSGTLRDWPVAGARCAGPPTLPSGSTGLRPRRGRPRGSPLAAETLSGLLIPGRPHEGFHADDLLPVAINGLDRNQQLQLLAGLVDG